MMPSRTEIQPLIDAMRSKLEKVRVAAAKAAGEWGSFVVSEGQIITPIDTGHLRGSGRADPPAITGNRVTCRFGFNAVYAAAVHERLDLSHAAPTQAKFLETTIRRVEPQFAPFVRQRLQEAIRE